MLFDEPLLVGLVTVLREVPHQLREVGPMFQMEQMELAVGLDAKTPCELLLLKVLERPPKLHPHPFDVVRGDAGGQVAVELKAAEPL